MSTVSLTVNGQAIERDVPDNTLLAFFLREELGLTGTHVGCDTSQCGCCVVRLDGTSVKSCTTLVHQIQGSSVETVESLARGDQLHPIQQAFTECHALQCGYCTPGMLIASAELLKRETVPTREEIRYHLSGNYCRCTGYHAIVDAVEATAKARRLG